MPDLRGFHTTIPTTHFHKESADFADEVVRRAITFASNVTLPTDVHPSSDALISKHVDAQLAFFKSEDYSLGNPWITVAERSTEALEALAKAHAEDGVRVKVTQPWHRDARERD